MGFSSRQNVIFEGAMALVVNICDFQPSVGPSMQE